MSVEAFLVAELVEQGSPRKAFEAGLGEDDFDEYGDEFAWIVTQAENRLPITHWRFKKKFPDFEFLRCGERIQDLIETMKQERAFVYLRSAIEEAESDLDFENAIEKTQTLKDTLSEALKSYAPRSDVLIGRDWKEHLAEQKRINILREAGESIGIPTGFAHLDHHWGGHQGGNLYLWLGRPGDAKSFGLAKCAVSAMLDGRRVGVFSPEMSERQHRCRYSTLISAMPSVQEACHLKGAFRNRALMDGQGYNYKSYKRFLEYVESMIEAGEWGEICLFTQKYRREKMSPRYIESRIDEMGLEIVFIDPIYKLKSPKRRNVRHEELLDITDALQDLSEGFNIPVIVSNQANRALVGTRGDAPGKDTSFGSDAPVQEADYVIGCKHFSEERLMKLSCSKSRYGESFKFEVAFWPNVGKIEEVTPLKGDYYNSWDSEKAEQLAEVIEEATKEKV